MPKPVPKLGQKQLRILQCFLENGSYPGKWIYGNQSSTMKLINSLQERELVGVYQGATFNGGGYTYYHLTPLGRQVAASITRYQPTPEQRASKFGQRLSSHLIYTHSLLPAKPTPEPVPARKSTEQLIYEAEVDSLPTWSREPVGALVERLRELEQQIKKGNTKP